MRHAKKSTNRDFRITFKEVPEAEDQAQQEEESVAQGSDDESQVCKLSVCSVMAHGKCLKMCTLQLSTANNMCMMAFRI